MVTRKNLEELFAHYIERKRYNQANSSDPQNGLWSAGECDEARKWLSMFGVDLSDETVQPMVEGKASTELKMKKEGIYASYDDLIIFVPEKGELISLSKGTGDNLLAEDREDGYVDYIEYTQREGTTEGMEEIDGGMMMFKQPIQNKYSSLAGTIPDLLEYIYDELDMDYAIICR